MTRLQNRIKRQCLALTKFFLFLLCIINIQECYCLFFFTAKFVCNSFGQIYKDFFFLVRLLNEVLSQKVSCKKKQNRGLTREWNQKGIHTISFKNKRIIIIIKKIHAPKWKDAEKVVIDAARDKFAFLANHQKLSEFGSNGRIILYIYIYIYLTFLLILSLSFGQRNLFLDLRFFVSQHLGLQ